ncbi:MAG: hypothetical protein A3F80_07875 [Candidatus Melainabacteria bacterium RIFCSPLOWO2_12_FULL_35_11]|nr:MAG: hypothetical protein A3F80_07875 [Candidatus Melainabacteria bacterium RIFCSPLOWO2_12_FULL_35_11]
MLLSDMYLGGKLAGTLQSFVTQFLALNPSLSVAVGEPRPRRAPPTVNRTLNNLLDAALVPHFWLKRNERLVAYS